MPLDWLNLGITLTLSLLFGMLIYALVATRVRNKKIFTLLVQSEQDKKALLEFIERHELENQNKNGDGFVRFLSESRDWAFQYIEGAQKAIESFKNVFAPVAVTYELDKVKPNDEEFVKIISAYRDLVQQLPEQETKKNV